MGTNMTTIKKANGEGFWAGMGRAIQKPETIIGAATAAAPIAIAGANLAIQKIMQARKKATVYKEMMEVNPALKSYGDPQTTQRYFNIMFKHSPEMASDPLVAGAWVNRMHAMNDPSSPHAGLVEGIGQLSQIRSNMAKGRDMGRGGFAEVLQTHVPRVTDALVGEASLEMRSRELKGQQAGYDRSAATALDHITAHEKERASWQKQQKAGTEALSKREQAVVARERAAGGGRTP